MISIFKKIFDTEYKELKKFNQIAEKIEDLDSTYSKFSDKELSAKTNEFKERLANGEEIEDIYKWDLSVIFKNQKETGLLVLNFDNSITTYFASESSGKVVFFSAENKLDNGVIYDKGIIKSCIEGLKALKDPTRWMTWEESDRILTEKYFSNNV